MQYKINKLLLKIKNLIKIKSHFQGRTPEEFDKNIQPALHSWGSKLTEKKEVENAR